MSGLTLESSLADLGLNIEQIKAMDYFLNELLRWNRVHNLTAIEDTDSAINLHLIDSIVIFPILMRYLGSAARDKTQKLQLADMGSGGGLIPLAILQAQWSLYLIEASKKKAAFLQHVRGGLQLKNMSVMAMRVEQVAHKMAGEFDAVTARAFTRLKKLLELARPLLKPSGLVFAMKSQRSEEEIAEVSKAEWTLLEECALALPGQKVDRRLLVFQIK
ncbi:MAG: 16S rRNA (guanine(527)-N(7))-methyltransferase RsmG [Burkholderiaceae bacterium]|nr:16S rRNA (guanine(527)-N(7))-methyltransferase RsmG [Burkholderiaceae bacterium]